MFSSGRARGCYSKSAHALVAYARARTVCLHHVDKVTVESTEKERLVFTFDFFFKRIFGAGILHGLLIM